MAPDGTEYPCDVIRDDDEDGMAVWVAVPSGGPLPWLAGAWELRAAVLPARSALRVEMPYAG